jgi:hypothetical protein
LIFAAIPFAAMLVDAFSNGDTLIAIGCSGLAAVVFMFVFGVSVDASDLTPYRSHLDELFDRRDAIYDNLRDLKFEYRAGKYAEADFETMRQTLETEAATVLAEIEQVTESPSLAARRAQVSPEKAAR